MPATETAMSLNPDLDFLTLTASSQLWTVCISSMTAMAGSSVYLILHILGDFLYLERLGRGELIELNIN